MVASRFPNIRMVQKRFATIWGGASLLQMLLSSMGELLEMPDWQWDFVMNLSESDYPLRPLEDLEEFLGRKKGKNFVKSHGRDTADFVRKQAGIGVQSHESCFENKIKSFPGP